MVSAAAVGLGKALNGRAREHARGRPQAEKNAAQVAVARATRST